MRGKGERGEGCVWRKGERGRAMEGVGGAKEGENGNKMEIVKWERGGRQGKGKREKRKEVTQLYIYVYIYILHFYR